MKKGIIAVLSAVLVFATFIQIGFCEITNEIRYNGRLKGYTIPLSGNVRRLKFEYFNEASGGTLLYYEEHNVTPNADGVFSVVLKPNIEWQKHKDIWLQLSIDDRPMTPREKIMSQPYSQHSKTADNGVPAGTVIAFAGENLPNGYLPCDGREVDQSDYPDLFAAIGSLYGTSTGGKFKLPNFQGMFLRGSGSQTINVSSKGSDPNQNKTDITITANPIGIVQGDTIRKITGVTRSFNGWGSANGPSGAFTEWASGSSDPRGGGGSDSHMAQSFDSSRVAPTSDESRPVNYAVNYYIKY